MGEIGQVGVSGPSASAGSQQVMRVLFVDDEPQILESLRDQLRPWRKDWQMVFVDSAPAALAELERERFDVVVSDMRMPGMDGAQLLTRVSVEHPETIRIVLSGYADNSAVAAAAMVAHRFLAKPCDEGLLVDTIRRACGLHATITSTALSCAASGITSLPSVPSLYLELTALLADPSAGVVDAAAIIERDIGMAAKALQLANSAYFGGGRQVVRLQDAVAYVGIEIVRSLALSAQAFAAFDPNPAISGFSIDALQRHCALTARISREIAPKDGHADYAFTAALLHDVGKLILAKHDPKHLAELLERSEREGRALIELERDSEIPTHAELGAHLLHLWGLPAEILEAVALHHEPPEQPARAGPITTVYIANALANEAEAQVHADTPPAAQLDPDLENTVEGLGLAGRLPAWRELALNHAGAGQPAVAGDGGRARG